MEDGDVPGARHGASPGVRRRAWAMVCALAVTALAAPSCGAGDRASAEMSPVGGGTGAGQTVSLPQPRASGTRSVEEALAQRRSVRDYADEPLTAAQLAQLLWAAQGITMPSRGLRTAPSAGALYPLEVYVAVERVVGVPAGVYHYAPGPHRLELVVDRPVRAQLCEAALSQAAVADAPATVAIAAEYARTTGKYGERGRRYAHLEAGHAAQNVYLQAIALGLGTVVIGAFDDERVNALLGMKPGEAPLYLMPVGAPAER
jgi:SagB-type dehydrogenase family enzyme